MDDPDVPPHNGLVGKHLVAERAGTPFLLVHGTLVMFHRRDCGCLDVTLITGIPLALVCRLDVVDKVSLLAPRIRTLVAVISLLGSGTYIFLIWTIFPQKCLD